MRMPAHPDGCAAAGEHTQVAYNSCRNRVAIVFGTGSGVLTARTMSLFLKTKTNPQIGSAGIASVPIAARVFQCRGEQGEPGGVPRFPPLTLIERLPALLAARDVPAERRRPERSIADITFSWPRLRWPTLALRHAGPWSRRYQRRTGHDRRGLCGWRHPRAEVRDGRFGRDARGAPDLADRLEGDAGKERPWPSSTWITPDRSSVRAGEWRSCAPAAWCSETRLSIPRPRPLRGAPPNRPTGIRR